MFKKATVVMLSINEKAKYKQIIKCIKGETSSTKLNQLAICEFPDANGSSIVKWENQHLYIVSDDKIEKNDWYIGDFKEIKQATNFTIPYIKNCDNFKKIIATTDQSLLVPAYTISNIPLPQPSQQFIEKYIEEYNKNQKIIDVLVEYEVGKCNCKNISIFEDCINEFNNCIKTKINSKDNTITIRRTKDSWHREEVEKLIMKYALDEHGIVISPNLKNWIKNNL